MTSKPEGREPQMPPRIWLFQNLMGTWDFTQDSADPTDLEYLSLQEHQQLLAEAVARARGEGRAEFAATLAGGLPPWDCGSHSCAFARYKGGQRTNGPCRCLDDAAALTRGDLRLLKRAAMALVQNAKAAELSKGPEAAGEDGNA